MNSKCQTAFCTTLLAIRRMMRQYPPPRRSKLPWHQPRRCVAQEVVHAVETSPPIIVCTLNTTRFDRANDRNLIVQMGMTSHRRNWPLRRFRCDEKMTKLIERYTPIDKLLVQVHHSPFKVKSFLSAILPRPTNVRTNAHLVMP